MGLEAIFFYLFSGAAVASAIFVIIARNPVHAVLFLILAFFSAAGLFVLLGAEFLAMLLVIVYVGAVAVLFLFVVMMLDVDFAELRAGFIKNAPLGLLIAFILFAASHGHNNIKRLVRHPQLSAVALWGIAHLLANGESRSIVLFGGLALWAVVEIVLINRREGALRKPEPAPRKKDVIAVVGGVVVYGVIAAMHQWLFGFSPFV